MNTMKSVFSKIAEDKTELAKHEVNLAIVDEFKAMYNASKLFKDNTEKNIKDAAFVNKQALQIISAQEAIDKKQEDLEKKAEKLYNEFSKAAKELGLNPKDSEAFKLYNDILKELVSSGDAKSIKSIVSSRI